MKPSLLKILLALIMGFSLHLAVADVSGNWVFSVTLGDLGSGDATISLKQEADNKLTGSYSGQLTNGPIEGTYEGDKFEFSFSSAALGADITYSGELDEAGSVKGTVTAGGQEIGTFTGRQQ